jgi:Zn-dependent peptidase ImmA (M78 family)
MPAFTVNTNPAVLEWARESLGLPREAAAKKIGVDHIVLRYWEEGAETDEIKGPSLAQLRRMAEVYKRPLAALLLPKPPEADNPVKTDFRLLPQNQGKSWSPELRVALRRVQMQRGVAEYLAEIAGEIPPSIDLIIALTDDPEKVGGLIRGWLGQPGGNTADNSLGKWIELIEAKTILVTQIQRVRLEEMRGCSISDRPFPAIILNGADSQNGKVFTLLHELAHILLRAGGVCDLEDQHRQPMSDHERVERFCNQVAATTLMPRAELLGHLRAIAATPGMEWPDKQLAALADRYAVSQEALLLRLVSLNWASWDVYFARRPHYLKVYDERKREKEQGRNGGPNYYTLQVRDFGRRYINAVLDAYYRQEITNVDLARYLNIKVNKVSELEATLGDR